MPDNLPPPPAGYTVVASLPPPPPGYSVVGDAPPVRGMERLGGTPPPIARPPLPGPLQGPSTIFGRAAASLPSSLLGLPAKIQATTPGVPQGQEALEKDANGDYRYRPNPLRDVKEGAQGIWNFLTHADESFANDPAGTVLQAAQLLKGAKEAAPLAAPAAALAKDAIVGAGKGAWKSVPNRYGVSIPGSAVATGAGTGAYLAGKVGLPHELGAVVGGAAPIVKGALEEIKTGIAARKTAAAVAASRANPATPAWANIPDTAPAAPVAEAPGAPATLPSGRTPGSIAAQTAAAPPARVPAWQRANTPDWNQQQPAPAPISAAMEEPAAPPSPLPSGRVPGSMAAQPLSGRLENLTPEEIQNLTAPRPGHAELMRLFRSEGLELPAETAPPARALASPEEPPLAGPIPPARPGAIAPGTPVRPATPEPVPFPRAPEMPAGPSFRMREESDPLTNPWKTIKQDGKAAALAEFLHQGGDGIPHADALRMDPFQWRTALRGAAAMIGPEAPEAWTSTKTPPSPQTVRLALSHLQQLEQARAAAPPMAPAADAAIDQHLAAGVPQMDLPQPAQAAPAPTPAPAVPQAEPARAQLPAGLRGQSEAQLLDRAARFRQAAQEQAAREQLAATGTDGPSAVRKQPSDLEQEIPTHGGEDRPRPTDGAGIRPGGESAPVQEAPQPSGRAGQGSATSIPVPGESSAYSARYKLAELKDLQASHNGATFQNNPAYELVNDRDYTKGENQGKILSGATKGKFNPAYLVTDNPDASNGPPVVDSRGNVIGGNGRSMILQRVYSGNPEGSAAYRAMLKQKAAQFGIDPAHVDSLKQPVLVREIADADLASPQKAVTDFNKSGTAALRPSERTITDSRRVSGQTLDSLANRMDAAGPDATLSEVLAGAGGARVFQDLIRDGVITEQETAGYMNKGALTKEGQARIGKMLLGRFFRDPEQVDSISQPIKKQD